MPDNARKFSGALLALHAQTALHPWARTALGTVDLPVQRERHTHWPTIAGSALKGILRDGHREQLAERADLDNLPRYDNEPDDKAGRRSKRAKADAVLELNELYGPPTAGSHEFGGALSVTDARLLAFPVRSLKGVFAWVSCPEALRRLQRDAGLAGVTMSWSVPDVADNQVVVPAGCPCLIDGKHVVLEEFEFVPGGPPDGTIAPDLANKLLPDTDLYQATRQRFQKHFLVLSDNDFTHFVRHATEVSARIGLNYDTKTVKSGALFYQEFLPAETLFYSVVLVSAARTRNGHARPAGDLLKCFRDHLPSLLQVGGDETTGKGLCATRLEEVRHGDRH
jgi:CRISPR-associated protein Cmr4